MLLLVTQGNLQFDRRAGRIHGVGGVGGQLQDEIFTRDLISEGRRSGTGVAEPQGEKLVQLLRSTSEDHEETLGSWGLIEAKPAVSVRQRTGVIAIETIVEEFLVAIGKERDNFSARSDLIERDIAVHVALESKLDPLRRTKHPLLRHFMVIPAGVHQVDPVSKPKIDRR